MKIFNLVFFVFIHVSFTGCGTDSKLSGENASTLASSTSTSTSTSTDTKTGSDIPNSKTPETAEAPKKIDSGWSLIVAGKDKLPPCDAATDGRLAYVSGTKTVTACQNGAWTDISINGKNSLVEVIDEKAGTNCKYGGKAISTGVDSDEDGKLGSADKISKQYVCNGSDGLQIAEVWEYENPLMNSSSEDISEKSINHLTKLGYAQLTKFEDGSAFLVVNGNVRSFDSRNDIYSYQFSYNFFIPKPSGSATGITKTLSFDRGTLTADYKMEIYTSLGSTPFISMGVKFGSGYPTTKNYFLTKK